MLIIIMLIERVGYVYNIIIVCIIGYLFKYNAPQPRRYI